jgi:hypothetical protein
VLAGGYTVAAMTSRVVRPLSKLRNDSWRRRRALTRASLSTTLLAAVTWLGAAAAAGLVSSTLGCAAPPPVTANVKAGDLAPAGDWSGVFYSPLYGHLHLVRQDNVVSGKWRTTSGDKWGELHGEVTGDLLKYKWVEHRIGMIGPGSTAEGHGYFKYFVPADENANHEIKGEWGLEKSEIGNRWEAVRQRNMLPEPNSVQPDETERVNMPDEWDSAAKPKGAKGSGDAEGPGAPEDAKGDQP